MSSGVLAFLAALAALLSACLGVWAGVRLVSWVRAFKASKRVRRALRGEQHAGQLLARSGYEVLGRQVRCAWPVSVDGSVRTVTLIADYVVQSRGKRWVAEVKTGSRALSLRHAPTRRQLLEYSHAFDTDGVLLVDPESEVLQLVAFPRVGAGRGRSFLGRGLLLLLLFLVALGAGVIGLMAECSWLMANEVGAEFCAIGSRARH